MTPIEMRIFNGSRMSGVEIDVDGGADGPKSLHIVFGHLLRDRYTASGHLCTPNQGFETAIGSLARLPG